MKIERVLGGLVSLGIVAALAVPLARANSQAVPAPQTAGKQMGMHGGLQAAVESLNLTDDQKAKVKDILAFASAKMSFTLAFWSSVRFKLSTAACSPPCIPICLPAVWGAGTACEFARAK